MLSLSSPDSFFKEMEAHKTKVQNELGVAVYGDLGNLFRRENPSVAGKQKHFYFLLTKTYFRII